MASRLITAYKQWSDEPLPHGSPRDEVDQLHAEIATIDMWITDLVVPYVEHGQRFQDVVGVPAEIDRALKRVDELRPVAHAEDRELLNKYEHYLKVLDEVFRALQEES